MGTSGQTEVGEVMAYGVPWSDRDYEPDPREIVEEAARAAGMTVSEWLNRASHNAYDRQDYRNTRPSRQQRRYESRPSRERSSARDSGISEDRISRILDGAMESIEDSLRGNEDRTASVLEALERRLSEMEHVENRTSPSPHRRTTSNKMSTGAVSDSADLVRTLENKISNVVSLLESKSSLRQDVRQSGGASEGTAQTQRLSAMEDAIRQLSSKLESGAHGSDHTPSSAFASAIEDMQSAVRGLQDNQQQGEVLDSIRQLEKRLVASAPSRTQIAASAHGESMAQPLARIHEELSRIRQKTNGFDNLQPVSNGFSALERQMGSISDRIDALTEKVSTARLNGPRDLRVQKPVDTAFDELKSLILKSQAPATDSRVLESLQALERKVDAMERGPSELAIRLDRIQSMIGEKPAGPMPRNLEPLLQNIVSRLEQVQNGGADDRAFEKLHQEIRQLSQKIEETPRSLQMPAGADISGVERHLTQLFQQLDSLKDNMGEVAQRAATKAAADTFSQQNMMPRAAAPDTVQLEKALSDIQASQQEGERRTHQTLEAVHSTLQTVIDRLVDMERDIQTPRSSTPQAAQPFNPPVAPQPLPYTIPPVPQVMPQAAPQFVPQPLVERTAVISRAKPLQDYALDDMPEQATHSHAQQPIPPHQPAPSVRQVPVFDPSILPDAINAADQSFARSADGIRPESPFSQLLPEQAQAPVEISEPPAKSGMAAVFAAAKNAVTSRKKDNTFHDAEALVPSLAANEAQSGKATTGNALFDMPLEPGAGRPVPGQFQPSRLADAPLVAAPADPKAAFLAAARRAAQAAAEQSAEVLAQGRNKGIPALTKAIADKTSSAKAAVANAGGTKVGLTKKHAILLGLAALIVAVGAALQFTSLKQQATAPVKDVPERTGSLNPATPPQKITTPMTTASVQPARQILPGPTIDALPAPLETATKEAAKRETPVSASTARDLATREKAAREMIARTEERLSSTSATRAASPLAAFGPLDPASVGSISPPAKPADTAISESPSQSAALPPTKSMATDPLFKFEGVRGAERLKQAARTGDANAFLELGNRFADGRGAPRDPKIAAQWYERASEFGSAPAQYRLASMYREGRGLDRNPKVALKHFQAAADAGNARAMHNTAVLLAEGVNGTPDYAGAADWFRKAAEHGIKDSQFNLAILYARGLGTPQDLMASYAWFAAAGGQGDDDAVKKRDEVGTRLSPDKLVQAKAAATTWKARTPDPAANEVIAPAGGWDDQAKTVPPEARPKASRG